MEGLVAGRAECELTGAKRCGSFLELSVNQVWNEPIMIMTNLPQDFAKALEKAGLVDFFTGCTRAHQNEYLKWITEAKRPETREKRLGEAMRMLANKRAEENARSGEK